MCEYLHSTYVTGPIPWIENPQTSKHKAIFHYCVPKGGELRLLNSIKVGSNKMLFTVGKHTELEKETEKYICMHWLF